MIRRFFPGSTFWLFALAACVAVATGAAPAANAQEGVRDRIAKIRYPPIELSDRIERRGEISGVPVYYSEEPDFPLATAYAVFRGGAGRLPRELLGAATALPALLRTGGAGGRSPEAVDLMVEEMALSMTFGVGGGSVSALVNSLSRDAPQAWTLWFDMLARPNFDSVQVEIWRAREAERVRRRAEDPAATAFSLFNSLMYGDHPVGWELTEEDLAPELVTPERIALAHRRIACRENMAVGVTGAIKWAQARALLASLVPRVPECEEALAPYPVPELRREAGVFLLHRPISQSVIVMAHPTAIRQADTPEYFASRVGNMILGGAGLSSRISKALRSREGLAYSASTIWTAPKKHDGIFGAMARTKAESSVEAARLILEVIDSAARAQPSEKEVRLVLDQVRNSAVFGARDGARMVARQLAYEASGLPLDWDRRYLRGMQRVRAEDVLEAFSAHVRPTEMTILIVGDASRLGGDPESLGKVTVLRDPP